MLLTLLFFFHHETTLLYPCGITLRKHTALGRCISNLSEKLAAKGGSLYAGTARNDSPSATIGAVCG